jgi:glycosyltransferase involved in cell wall biosynthesis
MKTSIIIPTLNEHNTIGELLEHVDRVDLNCQKEIIIVDGNSTDGTQDIIRNFAEKRGEYTKFIFEDKPEGKGSAVRKGIDISTGDIIAIQDGDLEVSPDELPKLIKPILEGKEEAVFGSRFLKGRGATKIGSYLGNKIITLTLNLFFFTRLTDIATCHKVVKKSVIQNFELKAKSFDFDSEITTKILKTGVRIKELPIEYIPRSVEDGKKLHWSIGFKVILAIIKYKFFK